MSTSEMEIDTKALSLNNNDENFILNSLNKGGDNQNETEEGIQKDPMATFPTSKDEKNEKDSDDEADDDMSVDSNSSNTHVLTRAHQLKEEGNAHFKNQKLGLAARSYRKATTSLRKLKSSPAAMDPQLSSLSLTLYTNHSMVMFKQKKWKQSKDLATMALDIDSNHVKALYRRAMAAQKLQTAWDLETAKNDLKKAIKLEPENRDVRKGWLLVKKDWDAMEKKEKKGREALKKAMSKGSSFLYEDKESELKKKALEKKKRKEEKEKNAKKLKEEWEDECVKKLANEEPVVSFDEWKKEKTKKADEELKLAKEKEEKVRKEKEAARRRQREQARKEESSDDDEEDEEIFRGYKKTSDGRTTSYFNREISEQEKKMIGNITPQRIEAPIIETGSKATTNKSKAESAWNAAGTWEERDTTDWCTSALRKRLLETALITDSYSATITAIDSISGHASFVLANGKKRYIFDYTAKIKFIVNDDIDDDLASGTLSLIDVCSGTISNGGYEVLLEWKKYPVTSHADKILPFCQGELVNGVKASVLNFVDDFNSTY